MGALAVVLQLVRVGMLVALAFATGWAVTPLQRALSTLNQEEMVRLSTIMVVIGLLFVVVLLVGRRRWHAWGVLIAEGLIAAVLALVPGALWIIWLGFSEWTNAMLSGWVQPLAIAWLGVVVAQGFHQVRDGAPRSDAPANWAAPAADQRISPG